MTDGDARIAALARARHGLVTRRDALAVLTPRQLERRVASGRLERVRPQVYRVAGAPETWEQTVLGACLAAGDGAFASHTTAAALWALAGLEAPGAVEVTTPTRRRRRIEGVVVHDTQVLGRRHVTSRDAIPVSSPARTLCDLTWRSSPEAVERALDDALRRELTTLRTLRATYLDLAGPGRRRCTVMRTLLDARLPGLDPGDSPRELDLLGWIVAAGLPRPAQQHRVRLGRRSCRIGLAYPELMIAIEYEAWDGHRSRRSFAADRARQNELEIRGWLVLRFTASSTREDVVAAVRAAIDARRRMLAPARPGM